MSKIFVTILAVVPFLCLTSAKQFNLVGEFIGYDAPSSKYEGYTYFLNLYEDSSFVFERSRDLYKFRGVGVWNRINNILIIEFKTEHKADVMDALIAGGNVEGLDTFEILNDNTLKLGNVVLNKVEN